MHRLNGNPYNTSSQHILATHLLSSTYPQPPSQPTLSIHLHTLTHLFIHPLTTSQPTLTTHLLVPPSHPTLQPTPTTHPLVPHSQPTLWYPPLVPPSGTPLWYPPLVPPSRTTPSSQANTRPVWTESSPCSWQKTSSPCTTQSAMYRSNSIHGCVSMRFRSLS